MGYEIFIGILEFHFAPVPSIKTEWSLSASVEQHNKNLEFECIDFIRNHVT